MGPIGITSFVSRSPSSKVSIALLLNVALLAGAGFALYRFRQAWLTSKVFFPVTIASSSVGVVALAALNWAIWRSKRVNPAEIKAAQPVLPPHDDGNPTGVTQALEPSKLVLDFSHNTARVWDIEIKAELAMLDRI